MVQLGGLEPPTSGSTDRRSNQLSYSCIDRGQTKSKCRAVQAALQTQQARYEPGLLGRLKLQIQLILKFLLTLDLIGSAVSAVTFWASAENSLACAVSDSNC